MILNVVNSARVTVDVYRYMLEYRLDKVAHRFCPLVASRKKGGGTLSSLYSRIYLDVYKLSLMHI